MEFLELGESLAQRGIDTPAAVLGGNLGLRLPVENIGGRLLVERGALHDYAALLRLHRLLPGMRREPAPPPDATP